MREVWHPQPYQDAAWRRMVEELRLALFVDPGLGKTATVLQAFKHLRDVEFESHRMLVVAPLLVAKTVWPREIAKWAQFAGLRWSFVHGARKADALHVPADVFLINPEGLAWLAKQRWRWPDMLVVDESTKFKTPGTQRFKALRRMLPHFRRRYILTGTPSANSLLDLWGQVYILDEGERLERTRGDFQRKFFVPVPRGNWVDWQARRGADEAVRKLIQPIVYRADSSQLDELPDLVEVPVRVDMPKAAKEAYDEFRKELVASFGDHEVVATDAGVLSGKCRQIASGAIYVDEWSDPDAQPDGTIDGRAYRVLHRAKEAALRDLIDELNGKPVLVAYEFKHDLAAIARAVGDDVPAIDGNATPAQADQLVERWNAGELPVLALHPRSGGHGLNMQDGGHFLAWYSLTWSLELYDQVVRRLLRQGQRHKVMCYHILARGTVDETIARSLRSKERNQRALLDALRDDLEIRAPATPDWP